MVENIKGKLIVQFRDKKYSIEADEGEYYSVVGFIASRHTNPPIQQDIPQLTHVSLLKVPNRFEIEQFIKSQTDYEHSIEAITNYFLGEERSQFDENKLKLWDSAVRIKVKRLTETIAKSEMGHWDSRYTDGHKKTFKFIRQAQGDAGEEECLILPS